MSNVVAINEQTASGEELFGLIEAFLAATDLADSTRDVYRATFEKLIEDLAGDRELATITTEDLRQHLDGRYGESAPATYNRNFAAISSMFTWALDNDLIVQTPTRGLRRRKPRKTKQAERQQRPIDVDVLESLWTDHRAHSLRDRTFWAMAYDTAARANELLGLNVEDIDAANREAVVIGKGGSAERVYWSSVTARLLPKLIGGREAGPLFLGLRKPKSNLAPAGADLCPTTGFGRLSYRRAEEIFKDASGGATLHQLRHSRLTHLAESGEDTSLIKAKSRHSSLRSLERYVNPSADSIRALGDRNDPNRRDR